MCGSRPVSAGHVSINTSTDEIGAPLFYREVNLPFIDAVKDPRKIRWRFGAITKKSAPPVVLENLPVCGNCHSFSADGKTLGMDVDYANDKGSYAIVPVDRETVLDTSKIITWNDYRKQDNEQTFGLLSQVSPDGNWVVSTVKDLSVFVPKPDLAFSQLFFPVKGILAVYNRRTRSFYELPGANDRRFVNSNGVWAPDGKNLLFIRSRVYDLKVTGKQVLLSEDLCAEFLKKGKTFLYDIYRVPFNNGKGGTALPLIGASENGMSNYFPRFSPDGKWIVFCKAKSYSLLQPDSRLYIIPAAGGTPRLMNCNRSCMNSWHSFSPNGKCLIFSSKAFSIYTQLFLTHIDGSGMDTPPVLLDQLSSPDRAANIPEFVNAKEDAILHVSERFVNDLSYIRAAQDYANAYALDSTVVNLFKKALSINPNNAEAHYNLGTLLAMSGVVNEAAGHFNDAIRLDSNLLNAYCNLASLFSNVGRIDDALVIYEKVLSKKRSSAFNQLQGKRTTARKTEDSQSFLYAHKNCALIYTKKGYYDLAIREYSRALQAQPESSELYGALGDLYVMTFNLEKAKNAYLRRFLISGLFMRE